MTRLASKALLMAAVPFMWTIPAHADATQAESTASDQTAAKAGEIIVTAQKREQRLIDVPQSVSVISSDLLQQTHAQRLDDYFTRVPSASINEAQAGQARLILRGINTGGFWGNGRDLC